MLRNNLAYTSISIHAPRTGSDRAGKQSRLPCWYFNPRSPHGERQSVTHAEPITHAISIHAPRTGSDPRKNPAPTCTRYFNPRSPHGERPMIRWTQRKMRKFQSTLPARGATVSSIAWTKAGTFQSTLPARGATRAYGEAGCGVQDFNPRSPHGERLTRRAASRKSGSYFNPRSPHGERHPASVQFVC